MLSTFTDISQLTPTLLFTHLCKRQVFSLRLLTPKHDSDITSLSDSTVKLSRQSGYKLKLRTRFLLKLPFCMHCCSYELELYINNWLQTWLITLVETGLKL